jgi:lantibiotic modifying enzyme
MINLRSGLNESEERILLRAQQMLERIADNLRPPEEYSIPDVGRGAAMNAVLLMEIGALQGREECFLRAAAHLRRSMQVFDETPLSSSLYRGITGLGWALATYHRPDLLPECEGILRDLDMLLLDGVSITNNHNIDIINGIAGIVVYALARGADEESSRALWNVLDEVIGRYFLAWTPGRYEVPRCSGNNLGLAHGPAGLLAVAAVAQSRGLLSVASSRALNSGFETLWSQSRQSGSIHWYPTFCCDNTRSRLAWCYGALGIGAVFKLGISLNSANAERCALMITSSIEQYESGEHGIRDATLCHGYAGITLSLAYLARGIDLDVDLECRLRAAALGSAERALNAERPEIGIGAIPHATPKGMQYSNSFLEGGAGVALSIISAYTEDKRSWMALLGYYS